MEKVQHILIINNSFAYTKKNLKNGVKFYLNYKS